MAARDVGSCPDRCSVIARDDPGKRDLRAYDIDGVSLAAEERDSGQFQARLTRAADVEVEFIARSGHRIRSELETGRDSIHRQPRKELAEIHIDIERREIAGAVDESHARAARD